MNIKCQLKKVLYEGAGTLYEEMLFGIWRALPCEAYLTLEEVVTY